MTRTKSNRSTSTSSRSSSKRTASLGGSRRGRKSSTSAWLPISLGIVGVCGLVYGLMQISSVSEFMEPMISDVGEFFGLTSDEGIDSMNITHDRTYSSVV